MDNYNIVFDSICRVCLSQNGSKKMVPLIDKSPKEGLSFFGKAITIVTGVLLEKNDKLPKMMCLKCAYLLKQSIYFKLKCESTNQMLNRLIKTLSNAEPSDQNYKQKVCEYVMFSQYFSSDNSNDVSSSCKTPKHGSITDISHSNQDQNFSEEKLDIYEANSSDKMYDFYDDVHLFDNTHSNEKSKQYSNNADNILDTIQDIIDSEKNITSRNSAVRSGHRRQKVKIHSNCDKRNLICKLCHKVLANSLTYDHHMQRHNLCRYICDQCGKGFPVISEMHMHQVARHGTGPYLQCDHCPYKAPRKLNLIEHLRIHTGERPFTCEKCGLTFRRRAIWRNHLVYHMEKTHQCSYCPKKFFKRYHMLAHCNNVHKRMYLYMCSVCSVTYAKTETVKRHMLVKHGIPKEKQGRVRRVPSTNHGKDL